MIEPTQELKAKHWAEIEKYLLCAVPAEDKKLYANNPQLIRMLEQGTFAEEMRPDGILDTLRKKYCGSGYQTLTPSRAVLDEEESSFISDTKDLNYIGAVTYAVSQLAEAQEAKITKPLRIPFIRKQILQTVSALRAKEQYQEARRTWTEWNTEIHFQPVQSMNSDEALRAIQACAQDSHSPKLLKQAAIAAKRSMAKYLESQDLPDSVREAAEKHWFSPRPPVDVIEFETDEGATCVPYLTTNEYLDTLNAIAKILAVKYCWATSVVVPWLLSGTTPVKKVAKITYDIRADVPCCSRIILEIDPTMPGELVKDLYQKAVSKIIEGRQVHKWQRSKHLALASTAAALQKAMPTETWESAFERWNGVNELYSSLKKFKRECIDAYKRLVYPKFVSPPAIQEYPHLPKTRRQRAAEDNVICLAVVQPADSVDKRKKDDKEANVFEKFGQDGWARRGEALHRLLRIRMLTTMEKVHTA